MAGPNKKSSKGIKARVTPRLDESTIEFMLKYFPSLNRGVEHFVNSMPVIVGKTLHQIKGVFSENELQLLVEAMNGANLSTKNTSNLQGSVQDAIEAFDLDIEFKVDSVKIIDKLNRLSLLELLSLEIFLYGFWYGVTKEHDSVDQYIEGLLGELDLKK